MPRLGLGLGLGRRRGPGSTGVAIPDLPVEWWRSDLGVTLNVAAVSSWLGQKVGYDLAQGTGSDQPAYSASDANFNGVPSITGDGSSDWLGETAGAGTLGALVGRGDDTPWSLIITIGVVGTTAQNVCGWSDASDASNYKMRLELDGTDQIRAFRRSVGAKSSTYSGTIGSANVVSMVFDGTTVSMWVDNTLIINAEDLDTTDMSTNPDRFALFTDPDSAPGAFGNIACVEIRAYTGALSTANRQSEQVAMAAYAGVTLS